MAYTNRRQMSSNRTLAIVLVALVNGVLGYALVNGLAYNVIKQAAEDLKTFDVEDEPPPPPEKPPPPPEDVAPPPQVAVSRLDDPEDAVTEQSLTRPSVPIVSRTAVVP